jgi:MscS family membrane protein
MASGVRLGSVLFLPRWSLSFLIAAAIAVAAVGWADAQVPGAPGSPSAGRYETTSDQLRHVLVRVRELLYAHPMIDPDPARVRLVSFGAYALDLEIFAYVRTRDYNEFLAVREDLYLRVMNVVAESGAAFAFLSQMIYRGVDGLDPERARAAEAEVRRWREGGTLPLPEFPPERVAQLASTLDYPPDGSPQHHRSAPAGRG